MPPEDSGHALDAAAHQSLAPHGWPTLKEAWEPPFMRTALIAGLLVTLVCAYVGIYVVLKRIVFVGIALAEISSAGVALSLLIGWNPVAGSVLAMLAGIVLFSFRWSPKRVAPEAVIGIGWAVASAASVLLIARNANGEAHMQEMLFGSILTVQPADVALSAVGLGFVLIVHLLLSRVFNFVSFDPETAEATGYRVRGWEMLMYVTIGLAIAFSTHIVGVLLAFSALVIPPVTGLLLSRRLPGAFASSIAVGSLAVPVGLYLSLALDVPSSATIVAVMFLVLLPVGAIAHAFRH